MERISFQVKEIVQRLTQLFDKCMLSADHVSGDGLDTGDAAVNETCPALLELTFPASCLPQCPTCYVLSQIPDLNE